MVLLSKKRRQGLEERGRQRSSCNGRRHRRGRGRVQPPTRGPHVKKRALKNKSLAVSFNEKDLTDYVTGFHKRKKKRRKEAHKQQDEALLRKRIEQRKKRKLEKEFAIHGGAPPDIDGNEENHADEEEDEPVPSINGTSIYDKGDIQVTVTTSEICKEDEDAPREKPQPAVPTDIGTEKKQHSLSVTPKKLFKKASKTKSRPRPQKKRDRKKGKTSENKR